MQTAKMNQYYMDLAHRTALLSASKKRQVGCIIVKNDNIISFGWNGTPLGFDNACEDSNMEPYPWVVHAEINAICKAAKSTGNLRGAIMYVTRSPCYDCAKAILQSGIKAVYYATCSIRHTDAVKFLKTAKIEMVYY